MKTLLILLALAALSQAKVLGKSDYSARIVNGEDAEPGEIPYQVSLQYRYNSFHFCGGSVLNSHYVITAAHCVAGQSPENLKVIAGTVNLREPGSTHDVTRVIYHEDYDPSDSWRHDIALLKVETPFVESELLAFVPLPEANQVTSSSQNAVVSGWGRLWQGGISPYVLQRVTISIADQAECTQTYEDYGLTVHLTQVCADVPEGDKGSCHGDSGGPLTVDGRLTGLVSWANGCAAKGYPTVFTRVSKYIDWISEHGI